MTRAPTEEIAQTARALRRFLEDNREAEWVRFFGASDFPHNCCEGTSCLLADVLEEAFGLTDVTVVEGYNRPDDERHYWVEAGGLIYDLTADQFDDTSMIVGAAETPLAAQFPEIARIRHRPSPDYHRARAVLHELRARGG